MLEQRFLAFINDNHLADSTGRVLLAVSGGLDSMVMARLFQRTGQPFAVVHVNFGLRGAESDADAVFVKNMADHYGVPFHSTQVDTATVAAERGCSIQMAARDLRYDWFAKLLRDHTYVSVATAHHQNDVLETLLLNLTRGTGLAGLHGIAVRQGQLIRPLLFATRDELATYAVEQGITYREDSSNADDKYARNRIRHQVVPVLTDLNPNLLRETLPRTVERLRAAETLVRAELDRSWQVVADVQGDRIWLPGATLLEQPELALRLAEWLRPFGFGADQIAGMITSLTRPAGQVFTSATHRITHERDGLLLEKQTPVADYEYVLTHWPDAPINVSDTFTLTFDWLDKPADLTFPTDPATAYVDADRLRLPLTIRPWRLGDRFQPLGMTGSKLVSDFLNDLKLTRSEREQTAVLLSGDQIAWVIGKRIGHLFRVTDKTNQIMQITVVKSMK